MNLTLIRQTFQIIIHTFQIYECSKINKSLITIIKPIKWTQFFIELNLNSFPRRKKKASPLDSISILILIVLAFQTNKKKLVDWLYSLETQVISS